MKVEIIDIKFGYSCNNNCIHCVIAGHRERLKRESKSIDRTTEEIKELIKEAKDKGVISVVFTGGETTIRKDFFDLLKFAVNLNLHVSLQTNARMFCIEEFARKTISIAPDMHFEIAIHSHLKEHHEKITRVKGSFDQTLEGIKNLIKYGAKSLNFKVVISKLNFKDLRGIVSLANKLGIKQVDIAFPHGMGNALKYWFEVVPRYSEIKKYVIDCLKYGKKVGVKVTLEAIPFCFVDGFEDCISELHYLKLFLEGKTSELRQVGDPLMDWQKERLAIKAKASQCRNCKYFYVCEGVWEEYLRLYGSDEFKPVEGKQIRGYEEIKELLKRANLL
jgi:MoaA/NifB/PqqE/SkfB family radical SAM enzyme